MSEKLQPKDLTKPLVDNLLRDASTVTVMTKIGLLIGDYNLNPDSFQPAHPPGSSPLKRIETDHIHQIRDDYKFLVFGSKEDWSPYQDLTNRPDLFRIGTFLEKVTDFFGRQVQLNIDIKSSPNSIQKLKQTLIQQPKLSKNVISQILPSLFKNNPLLIPEDSNIYIE
jgi:hypothetical protein